MQWSWKVLSTNHLALLSLALFDYGSLFYSSISSSPTIFSKQDNKLGDRVAKLPIFFIFVLGPVEWNFGRYWVGSKPKCTWSDHQSGPPITYITSLHGRVGCGKKNYLLLLFVRGCGTLICGSVINYVVRLGITTSCYGKKTRPIFLWSSRDAMSGAHGMFCLS